jgi:hypothetical protein
MNRISKLSSFGEKALLNKENTITLLNFEWYFELDSVSIHPEYARAPFNPIVIHLWLEMYLPNMPVRLLSGVGFLRVAARKQ